MEIEKLNKFHNAKIYTIRSPESDKIYIGSTCQPLHKRLHEHRKNYQMFLNGKYHNISSFEVIKNENHYIELLEEFKCENKNQLHKREGELIREHKLICVNKCVAGRSKLEYRTENSDIIKEKKKQYRINNIEKIKVHKKQYYTENIDKLKEVSKQYHIDNSETIRERMKQYRMNNIEKAKAYQELNKERFTQITICECGGKYQFTHKSSHFKTKKHKLFFNII